jgi:hypothetical protein
MGQDSSTSEAKKLFSGERCELGGFLMALEVDITQF